MTGKENCLTVMKFQTPCLVEKASVFDVFIKREPGTVSNWKQSGTRPGAILQAACRGSNKAPTHAGL